MPGFYTEEEPLVGSQMRKAATNDNPEVLKDVLNAIDWQIIAFDNAWTILFDRLPNSSNARDILKAESDKLKNIREEGHQLLKQLSAPLGLPYIDPMGPQKLGVL